MGVLADFRELCMMRAKRVAPARNLLEIHIVLII